MTLMDLWRYFKADLFRYLLLCFLILPIFWTHRHCVVFISGLFQILTCVFLHVDVCFCVHMYYIAWYYICNACIIHIQTFFVGSEKGSLCDVNLCMVIKLAHGLNLPISFFLFFFRQNLPVLLKPGLDRSVFTSRPPGHWSYKHSCI